MPANEWSVVALYPADARERLGGENRSPDAAVIAANARRDFRAIKLDARARGLVLRVQDTTSSARLEQLRGSRHASASRGGSEQLQLSGVPSVCSDVSWRRARITDSSLSEASVSVRGLKEGCVIAERVERADAYVVHAAADHAIMAELCAWAEQFEAEKGRPPTVWLHQFCASRSLAPAELLAHLPCYLARSDRLLLLASPATTLDLTTVTSCYVWRVLGGRPSTVDAVLLASASPERTVAALDRKSVV